MTYPTTADINTISANVNDNSVDYNVNDNSKKRKQ
jgi:hypothetical protein